MLGSKVIHPATATKATAHPKSFLTYNIFGHKTVFERQLLSYTPCIRRPNVLVQLQLHPHLET